MRRKYEFRSAKSGQTATVVYYDGVADVIQSVADTRWVGDSGSTWNGGVDYKGACEKSLRGATAKEMKPISDLLDKIDAEFRDRESVQWIPDVAGAYPIVPEFLQGVPECMRRRQSVESDAAPIRLFVNVTVSSGVEIDALRKRGAALAALAMRLSEIRPVEMYACWGVETNSKNHIGAVRISTAPVSASEVYFLTADPAFCRNISFAAMCTGTNPAATSAGHIGWAFGCTPDSSRYTELQREALGLEPQDVYLTGGCLSDNDEMLKDPVSWVNRFLQTQRELE